MDSFSGNLKELRGYNVANIRLSSAYRSNLSDPNTNCTINYNVASTILGGVCAFDINSVDICNNFYNVASYNNTFVLQSYDGTTLLEYNITVPPNYYTAAQLATQLQTLIQAKPALSATTVTYDTSVNRFIFDTNTATAMSLQFSLGIPNLQNNNFLYIIGADPEGQPLSTLIQLPNAPALFGATTIYLFSDKLGSTKSVKNVITGEFPQRKVQSTTAVEILSININAPYGVYNTYYNNGSDRGLYVFNNRTALDSIDLKWVDDFDNVLEADSNNTPIYISMKVYY